MRLSALLVGLCAVLVLPHPAAAQNGSTSSQTTLPIVPGARVRVKAQTLVAPLVANYLELRGDTLVVFEESGGHGIWMLPLDQVERLETTVGERGRHRPYMTRGALYGSGAGLVTGVIFAAFASPSDSTRKYSIALTGLAGAAVGAGLGAFVGSRFTTERWTTVALPRRGVLSIDPRGLRISFVF